MAELNFGLLTPPGSQSIGNAFVQGMDQAAVARAQENQNALSQYTLGKAKREDELTNKMLAGMQSATTIEQQAAVLRSVGRYKDASDLMNSDLERRYRLGQIEAQPGALLKNKADTAVLHGNIMEREANAVVANPTSARAMQAVVNFGKATGQDVTQELKTLTELGDDPNKIAAWARGHALKGKDLAAFSTPKPTPTNVGDKIVFLDMNPNSPTFKSEVIPSQTIGAGPGTVPAIIQANVAVAGAQDRGEIVPGAAPAPVPRAAFPSITPQVQAERNAQQIAILNAELAKSNPADQQRIRAEIAKLSTGNPFAASGANPLPVVNNMPAAPVVNNLPTAQPPAGAAPGAYPARMLRDMALKGMQPDGKGGQTFIPGGEKDPVVEQRVATGKAVGAQIGKNNAVALEKLPNAITTGKELIRKLDEILGDANVVDGQIKYKTAPAAGFDSAFGPTGIIARAYPSSEAAGFQARVKEILGGAFLEAYETLRGAQGITDIEGKKATEARTRMGFDLSKTEFITAAREYRKTAAEALARSETRLKSLQGSGAPAGAPSLDAIFNPPRPQ